MALHLPSHSTSDAAERNLPTAAEPKEGVYMSRHAISSVV